MKWPSFYSACGTYSVVVESEFADILKIEGQKVVAQAPLETKLGIFNPVFTLRRDSNINQAITATISLTIKRPLMTALVLNEQAKRVATYTIGFNEFKVSFPTYHCLPCGCIFSLEYETQLISKTPDAKFATNHNFNQQSN